MEDAPLTPTTAAETPADTVANRALATFLEPVSSAEWKLSETASWLCMGAGMFILAFTILIPEMIGNQVHAHGLRVLEIQKERSAKTLERHQSMLLALENDDEALLEHLALTQLRLKRVGTRPLTPPPADPAADMTSVARLQAYVAGTAAVDAVENWLNPVQRPASELVPAYRKPPTRLVRWTTETPYRDLTLFLGLVLLAAGLWPKQREAAAGARS